MTASEEDYLPWIQYYHGERGHWQDQKNDGIEKTRWERLACEEMMGKYIAGCEACEANESRDRNSWEKLLVIVKWPVSGNRPGATWAIDLREVGEGYGGRKTSW